MKKILLILIIAIGAHSYAQQESTEFSPTVDPGTISMGTLDTFNLQFSFPCMAFIGEYGVESNGTDIYVTQWLDDSIARYDQTGSVLDRFVISGVGRTRDLAYDGQYYYGSPNDFKFFVLDLDNKSLISTQTTSFKVRGMAYDAIEDVLWASEHWTPMFYKLDKQGNILDSWLPSGITMDAISGLAFDNNSIGGPFLWGFSQDSSGAMIVKYDIASQTQTGSMIDVSGLSSVSSVAGGLFINEMASKTPVSIGGMIQNQLVFALELDYANQLVDVGSTDMITEFKIYPNPVADKLHIQLAVVEEAQLLCEIFSPNGQKVYETVSNVSAQSLLEIPTMDLLPGTYVVRISNEGKYTMSKRFVKGL